MSLAIIVSIKGPRERKGKKGRTSVIAAVAVVSIAVSFNIVTSCKLKPIFKVIIMGKHRRMRSRIQACHYVINLIGYRFNARHI